MPWWGWVLVAWPVVSVPVALLVAATVRRRDRRTGPVYVRDGACGWGCASVHLRGWQPAPDRRGAQEVATPPGVGR